MRGLLILKALLIYAAAGPSVSSVSLEQISAVLKTPLFAASGTGTEEEKSLTFVTVTAVVRLIYKNHIIVCERLPMFCFT